MSVRKFRKSGGGGLSRYPANDPVAALGITLGLLLVDEVAKSRFFPESAAWPSAWISLAIGSLLAIAAAYTVFSFLQVTRRYRQTILALSESEERYRSLFERVPVGLYRTTPAGQILDANPALVEMLGYPDKASLLAVNAIQIFVNPEDRRKENELVDQSGLVKYIEIQLHRYDQGRVWVRDMVRSVRGEAGQVYYYDGSLEDITERKRAEELRFLLAAIVESSEDAIIGQKLDGTIFSWNAAAERIYGHSADEMKGRTISVLIPPDRADELPDMISRIMTGGRVDHYETVLLRKDGRRVDISLTISPIKDPQGEILGISNISRDITEHKRLEQYLLRTERLAAMGKIIAALAHEIKNPLQAILSNLELVRDFTLEPDERQDCLMFCYREAERLNELTQQMLLFSRTEPDTVYPISIPQIWQQALAFLNKPLLRSKIQVTADFPEELPHIFGAADQIRQVFVNLMLNSIASMPAGGEIHLSTETAGETLVLNLRNSGPPIPADHIDHIFEPFSTPSADNTGLGLYIASHIILQHGGTISVENLENGAGVLCKIKLPVASPRKGGDPGSDQLIQGGSR